ncbi:MAG: ABC transporter ATP-binding protein [bacterium]|nr:ABC transporter ATP-binding protein [bacterium]MDE0668598.1 ABC transporter ATP-binding protein [bacterium]MYB25180.1 ABC transporter ATP-binding protein [Acidimicrobiia bacterium]
MGGAYVAGPQGPSSSQANAAAGLPFAGIPSEMIDRAADILESEPAHPEPEVEFAHRAPAAAPLSLRTMLRPHRRRVLLVVALVVIEAAATQAGPLLMQIGIDEGVATSRLDILGIVAAVYFATVAVHMAAGRARTSLGGRLGERLMYGLRVRVFSHFQRMSLSFYTSERAGVLMSRMTSDVEALTMLLQEGLVMMVVQGLTLAVITGVLFYLNVPLAALTVGVVVPVTLVLSLWFRRASESGYDRVRDRIAVVLADLSENLAGMRTITAYNRRRRNVAQHQVVVTDHEDANVYTSRVSSLYASAAEGVGIIGQAVVLGVGGWLVIDGRLTLGALTAFALYLTAFFAPIGQLVMLHNAYQQGQSAAAKLRELLARQPEVAEAPDAAPLGPIEGRISFEGVSFSYDGGDPVLADVNLDIPAGASLAIVGATGAGKSTIAKLAVRFYDPDEGTVRIDGADLRGVQLESLRRQFGVVPQEPFLFNGTIGDNIRFARPDAGDDEVAEACRVVGLEAFVASLPDGVDTPIHERGASLSAGERQLLALARAFLARPRVLILDEATSNLDLRSEARVERALDALLEGRTAVIVAHRLATAMRADRIAVVNNGRIAEIGSHEQLVESGGLYAAMFAAWESHATGDGAAATGQVTGAAGAASR